MGQFIDLKAADGHVFPAYVAQPAGTPKGAVVVLQEIFGVNSHIRSVADGYAAQGYLAVAPATFNRVKPGVELGYTEADMGEGFGYKTAVEALPEPGVLQDIQAAIDHAAYYGGGVTTPAEVARQPKVPVLAHFGDKDHWIPLDTVEAFRAAHPEVQVHVYAANHGFNCDQRGSYDEAAANTARERSLAFFAQHLA